jgi:UDP-N-acetylglucosamine 2-epimerase (non-hydrolysing)
MVPVIHALRGYSDTKVHVLNTGQHKDLLDGVLEMFGIQADSSLALMEPGQSLARLTARAVEQLEDSFVKLAPDLVLVHGDTSTAMAAAMAAFYLGIPVGHVEAGLRTRNLKAPFPEEMNRQVIARFSDLNFAPTIQAAENLKLDGIAPESIFVTGNTVVDSCVHVYKTYLTDLTWVSSARERLGRQIGPLDWGRKLVLVTLHRRENSGSKFEEVLEAVRDLSVEHPAVNFVFPVHPNPIIKNVAESHLRDLPNVFLTKPIDYLDFSWLLSNCDFAISDSGGIQEEGVSFGKHVLVAREGTERPEGIYSGHLDLVGSDGDLIRNAGRRLLQKIKVEPASLNLSGNPYGDGNASIKIAEACREFLKHRL